MAKDRTGVTQKHRRDLNLGTSSLRYRWQMPLIAPTIAVTRRKGSLESHFRRTRKASFGCRAPECGGRWLVGKVGQPRTPQSVEFQDVVVHEGMTDRAGRVVRAGDTATSSTSSIVPLHPSLCL